MSDSKNFSQRRNFIKSTLMGGSFLGLSPLLACSQREKENALKDITEQPPSQGESVIGLRVAPIKQVKVGVIGVGNRGTGLMKQVISTAPKAVLKAICDVREEQTANALTIAKERGQDPAVYAGSLDIWKQMIEKEDLDLVIIATPWHDHVPMSLFAMEHGVHVGVEVPAAITVDDCWKLVDMAEKTQRHCMMLENVCYGASELTVLNMVKKGVFGTLTHGEAAYIHDLRKLLFNDHYYDHWRMKYHMKKDGNLYPTHGLGPVAQYMDIGRGDRFNHIVSMSSREANLSEYGANVDDSSPYKGHTEFAHGDMNSSLIKTANGKTILVQHDVVTPRPYNRINAISGTKAYFEGYPDRLFIDGHGDSDSHRHEWLSEEDHKAYFEKYKHPIWDSLKEEIEKNGGHGGIDFLMMYRLIDCLNRGLPLDQDVYDAADWSVVTPLSAISIEMGNAPVKFPDFTRGRWKEERALNILANI